MLTLVEGYPQLEPQGGRDLNEASCFTCHNRHWRLTAIETAPSTESKKAMSERLETLKKARERMTDDRDAFAKVLAAPFDRDKAERARVKFIETQVLIDAIDRAILGEPAELAAAAWAARFALIP
jgi:hypothetical protein